MAEVDIDISLRILQAMTDEFVPAADIVITMGCGYAYRLVPGF